MIVAIDTCFAGCSVALSTGDGGNVVSRCEVIGRGHAERVFSMLAEVFGKAGASAADLTDIIATVGPGTFTGQRIGVACAQGLALGANAPARLWAAGSLQAIAATAARAGKVSAGDRAIAVVAAAGGDALYWQVFGPDLSGRGEPERLSGTEAEIRLRDHNGHVAGPAAEALYTMAGLDLASRLGEDDALYADARDLIALFERGCLAQVTELRPMYFRAPDAEPSRDILPRQSSL